jgi:hypothetical protein
VHRKRKPRSQDRRRYNRSVNCGVSVDLAEFLSQLQSAVGWERSSSCELPLGLPGEYIGVLADESPAAFAVNYLFKEVMSKYDDQEESSDASKTSQALAKFREAELMCTASNERFSRYFMGHRPGNPDVSRAITLARHKIACLLGKFCWDEVASGFTLTSGASAKLPRARGCPAYKFSKPIETTPENLPVAVTLSEYIPQWGVASDGSRRIDICGGNRLNCVPKNYKAHRLIAMEPSGNMFVQKGIGAALRRRLMAVGNDLSDQQPNQEWARFGSKTGLVATIDLSMASDTVSEQLVEWMLPADWIVAMSYCRSRVGVLPSGEKVLYRKWSSMGNAYTFELETLLFWALGEAVCEVTLCDTRFTRTYGDDIIIPSAAAPLMLEVLEHCGFRPNPDKSFWTGCFRESCGKHYFRGEDVTPFYIKSPVRRLSDLFLLVNNLERWRRRMLPILSDRQSDELSKLVRRMRSRAPSQWRRPRIPDGKGDGAFIGTFDECLPSRPVGKWLWWEGFQVEVLAPSFETLDDQPPLGDSLEMSTSSASGLTFRGFVLASLYRKEVKETVISVPPAVVTGWGIRGPFLITESDNESSAPVDTRATRWQNTKMLVTQFS